MKCNINGLYDKKTTKLSYSEMRKMLFEYIQQSPKMRELYASTYFMSKAHNEEEYNKMLQQYREEISKES